MARDESVRRAAREALERVGPDVVADAARLCGTAYPPAGKGGDFPRSRSGALAGAFSYRVEDGPNGPIFVLSNNAPHAGYVNGGTSKMAARPYLQLVMDKWGPEITRRTAAAVAASQSAAGSGRAGGVRGFARGVAGRVASALSSGFRSLFG